MISFISRYNRDGKDITFDSTMWRTNDLVRVKDYDKLRAAMHDVRKILNTSQLGTSNKLKLARLLINKTLREVWYEVQQ